MNVQAKGYNSPAEAKKSKHNLTTTITTHRTTQIKNWVCI